MSPTNYLAPQKNGLQAGRGGPGDTPEEERIVQVAEGLREETHDSPSSRAGASYYTDASVLTESYPDLPVVLYGPGDDRLAHQPNESIGFYEQIAARYFG